MLGKGILGNHSNTRRSCSPPLMSKKGIRVKDSWCLLFRDLGLGIKGSCAVKQ